MKKTSLLYSLVAILLFASCNKATKKDHQIIEGTIKGLGDNSIILMDEKYHPIDTVKAVNDAFIFIHNLEISKPKMQGIFLPQLSNKNGGISKNKAYFFIDSKQINVVAEIIDESLTNIKITGSPTTEDYNTLSDNFPSSIELDKYSKSYNNAFNTYNEVEQSEENLKELNYYSNIIDSLFRQKDDDIINAIQNNDKSIALSFIAYNQFNQKPLPFLKDLVSKFSPEIRSSYYLNKFSEIIDIKEKLSIGNIAPNFTLKDSNDNKISLSDFKGSYTLIDFWASWCGPCRKEIPNLKKIYSKYKDKGFKIVSVSIDNKEEDWKKALEKEQLPYIKLWDEEKITQKLYQYQGIPWMVLLNPDGEIERINDGLRGEELEKTIESLYNELK